LVCSFPTQKICITIQPPTLKTASSLDLKDIPFVVAFDGVNAAINREVTYFNEAVAIVSPTGTVTAVSAGIAAITANTEVNVTN
jgi:hypothetical protein